MFRSTATIFALLLATATANAALLGRAPATPGGTDYQAYYDTNLSITWLADANLVVTNTFGLSIVSGIISPAGRMPWTTAQAWIAGMNAAIYLGARNWRLPTVIDTGAPGCEATTQYNGSDCGYNVDLSTGEMSNLFYGTLANNGQYDTSGVLQPCAFAGPDYCLTSAGPFKNIRHEIFGYYWTGTEYPPDNVGAWVFGFSDGLQGYGPKINGAYAWAVRNGDIGAVPIPPAAFLFPSALAALGWVRRRHQ
jgi:hypothetical protein